MGVSQLSPAGSSLPSAAQPLLSQSTNSRDAFSAARQLTNLGIADREYTVVRDPASHRFVVVVLDGKTGDVLDQFPPENILKMLQQLSSFGSNTTESTGEIQG